MSAGIRELIKLSLPIFAQYLSYSIFLIIHTYFISRVGYLAISAYGTARYVIFILSGAVVGALLSSYTTLLSQTRSVSTEKHSKIFYRLYLVSSIASLLIIISIAALGPILVDIICPQPEIDRLALKYLGGFLVGVPGVVIFIQYLSSMYSIGKIREASISWIISDILNTILDPILMFNLRLSIFGAGLAFSLSTYAIIPLMHYFIKDDIKGNIESLWITRNILESLIHVGVFTYIERVIVSILYTVYASIISRYGILTYTAYQLGLMIESFIYTPILAFRDLSNILIGREIVKSREGVVSILNRVILVSLILTSLLAISLIPLSPIILSYFISNIDIIQLAQIYLILATISDLGHAVVLTEIGAFQGIGRMFYASMLDVACMTVSRIVPSFIASLLRAPIFFIWFLMIVDAVVRSSVLYVTYRRVYVKARIFV